MAKKKAQPTTLEFEANYWIEQKLNGFRFSKTERERLVEVVIKKWDEAAEDEIKDWAAEEDLIGECQGCNSEFAESELDDDDYCEDCRTCDDCNGEGSKECESCNGTGNRGG